MSDDDLFARWSRRKRAVEAEEERGAAPSPDPQAPPRSISGSMEGEAAPEEDEAEVLERLGLPVPESLSQGDDFSQFMAAGVPEFLRKRALRVLWKSNPVLANLDGLNDYDDDFTSPELTKKVLATGYQVGRGFLRDIIEGDEDEAPEEVVVAEDAGAEEEADGASGCKDLEEAAVQHEVPLSEDDAPAFQPRRMRFDV